MKTFELKVEHIKLLRRAYISWEDCEFGAPAIDCKRPYGNSSVISDIAEILGEEPKYCPHCGEPLEELDKERYTELHTETQTALQIILHCKTFEPGVYVLEGYGKNWKRK